MWPSLELTVLVVANCSAAGALFVAWRRKGAGRVLQARIVARLRPAATLSSFSGPVWVIDGDTVEVRKSRIRLFGMDAPELSQRGGYKARSHLIGLAGGKTVEVIPTAIDCYGRIVARVWLDKVDLSERMVRDGYAVAMSRWHSDYNEAERHARRHRLGLWADDPKRGIGDPAAHRRWKARIEAAVPESPWRASWRPGPRQGPRAID